MSKLLFKHQKVNISEVSNPGVQPQGPIPGLPSTRSPLASILGSRDGFFSPKLHILDEVFSFFLSYKFKFDAL